jgi:predicted Rossmann fold flavoprotein
MLEKECREANVQIYTEAIITEVEKASDFEVRTSVGQFHAPALVVATGGLSIPKIGATAFGYDLARQFGVRVREPWPALVPMLFNSGDRSHFCDLAGVATEVIASYGKQSFREKMLITHRGLSGPAILQISSYWASGHSIEIDLAPGHEIATAFAGSNVPRTAANLRLSLQSAIPQRLAARWLELFPPNGWSNSALQAFENYLHHWIFHPAGTEGYEKAEVTAGGVDTDELSAKTMESHKMPGLFFIGEVLDVTGQLGGFNFQWAWASGACAGWAL